MSLDEHAALNVTAVRAVETASEAQTFWSEADRAWASRVAAEFVGEGGAAEAFLAARARFALERIGERVAAVARAVAALRWRRWVGVAIVAAAFVVGAASDEVGGAQRINLIALPFFALIAWNLGVYVLLLADAVRHRGADAEPGPLRTLVARLAATRARPGRGVEGVIVARVAAEWSRLAAPLYAARAARILHLGAAAFALGLLAGLYLRGLAFEYRASWESTFLGAAAVHALLAAVFLPAAALTGIEVPSVAAIEAIRAPASENAARWLHLMALTVALAVVVPRLGLAGWMGLRERRRRSRLPIALDEPYFARLLRGFRGSAIRVRVVPYSYTMAAASASGLDRLLRGAFGGNAALAIDAPVAYGGEEALADGGEGALAEDAHGERPTGVIALFNATATPEREAHGAFLDALRRKLRPDGTLVALVDVASFRERWPAEPERLEARRASWRSLCAERRVGCAFVDLAAPDEQSSLAEVERALEGGAP